MPRALTIPVCINPPSKLGAIVRAGRTALWRSRVFFLPVAVVLPSLPVLVAPILIGSTTMSKTRDWNENDDQPDQVTFHNHFYMLSAPVVVACVPYLPFTVRGNVHVISLTCLNHPTVCRRRR